MRTRGDPQRRDSTESPRVCTLAGKLLARLLSARHAGLAYERERLILASTADRCGGARNPGVRHWIRYMLWGRGLSPIRWADEQAPREARNADEELLCDFALWLVYCQPLGNFISPKTARKYVSQVNGWHRRHPNGGFGIGGDAPLYRLRALIKGLRKEVGDGQVLRRWGVRTQDLARALKEQLSGGSAAEQNWRAALTVGFCGLLRGGELATQDGEEFNPAKHLTRGDVRFFTEGGVRFAGVMIRQLKTTAGAAGVRVEVILRGGGTLFDPVEELWQLFAIDKCSKKELATTPLFRGTTKCALAVKQVRAMVKALMAAVGCDPDRFGAHSLRIGGATAALAAGIDPVVIRAMGRWSSEVYEIYTRLTREAAARVSSTIASTTFHDMEREYQTDALDENADIPMYDLDLDMGAEDGGDDGSSENEL